MSSTTYFLEAINAASPRTALMPCVCTERTPWRAHSALIAVMMVRTIAGWVFLLD